jgi:hypothetical protein
MKGNSDGISFLWRGATVDEAMTKITEKLDSIIDRKHGEAIAMLKGKGFPQSAIEREMIYQAAELSAWRDATLNQIRDELQQQSDGEMKAGFK